MSKKPLVLRTSVRRFAEQMELKLRENDHKGGWQNDLPEDLLVRAEQELEELKAAVSAEFFSACGLLDAGATRPAVAGEAADVGNFCLMITDQCGALDHDSYEPEDT